MKRDQALERATRALGKRTVYKLGSGDYSPSAQVDTWGRECDCSGFICWVLQIPRQIKDPFYLRTNGGWVNTTSIVEDSKSPDGLFTLTPKPKPGDVIVYPWKNGRPGHIGLIKEVNAKGIPVSVIHCSSGNYRKTGDAIQVTPPVVWAARSDTVYARFDKMED